MQTVIKQAICVSVLQIFQAIPLCIFRYFVIADNNINIFADLKELVVSSFVDRRFGNQILNRCPLAHG